MNHAGEIVPIQMIDPNRLSLRWPYRVYEVVFRRDASNLIVARRIR
jgi:hypothetical protein